MRRLLKARMGLFGLSLLTVFFGVALLSTFYSPYDPFAVNFASVRQPPTASHVFGTDELGRDLVSRMMLGARITISIATFATLIAMVGGSVLGLLSGYFGGVIERVVLAVTDTALAFPAIFLAIAIVGAFGASATTVIVALSVWLTPGYIRLVRASTLATKRLDYVTAAVALGMRSSRVMFVHVLPNVVAPIIVLSSLNLARAVLAEAGLSFLGLGIQPPWPTWGGMIAEGRQFLRSAPHLSFFPGLATALLVIGFNLVGDTLRDALDPTMRN